MTDDKISVYNSLLQKLALCRNAEQTVNLLYGEREIVDEDFLLLFLDPVIAPFTKSILNNPQELAAIQTHVQNQHNINLVEEYVNLPVEHTENFIRKHILILLLNYSFN